MHDSIGIPLTPCFYCKGWVSSGGGKEVKGREGGGGVERLCACAFAHTERLYSNRTFLGQSR